MATKLVYLHAKDGSIVGTTEIDTNDGEPRLLQADTGAMFVRAWSRTSYVEAIPLAVIVKPREGL